MDEPTAVNHVFLSYAPDNQDWVAAIARRLYGDARLTFWFAPWHSVPGVPRQEQLENALLEANACAVFLRGGSEIGGWQNEELRAAIQTRVEDDSAYRVIPVLLPGSARPNRRDLPPFLRRYEMVEFQQLDDENAFQRLLAGILGIPPVQVNQHIAAGHAAERQPVPPTGRFENGLALVVGVAEYVHLNSLTSTITNDALDLQARLTDPAACGYLESNVTLLLNQDATAQGLRNALSALASNARAADTVVIFFSGHGARVPNAGEPLHYILPHDAALDDLARTAIGGDELTAQLQDIKSGRLLVLFDSCHSGGAGEPKGETTAPEMVLSESYYETLAQGKGRVIIASSRADEVSWALDGMRNSLFTHFLLQALRGECRTLGDGYVRVFDVFRHLSDNVPTRAKQHPIFKAARMEQDFPIALVAAASNPPQSAAPRRAA